MDIVSVMQHYFGKNFSKGVVLPNSWWVLMSSMSFMSPADVTYSSRSRCHRLMMSSIWSLNMKDISLFGQVLWLTHRSSRLQLHKYHLMLMIKLRTSVCSTTSEQILWQTTAIMHTLWTAWTYHSECIKIHGYPPGHSLHNTSVQSKGWSQSDFVPKQQHQASRGSFPKTNAVANFMSVLQSGPVTSAINLDLSQINMAELQSTIQQLQQPVRLS